MLELNIGDKVVWESPCDDECEEDCDCCGAGIVEDILKDERYITGEYDLIRIRDSDGNLAEAFRCECKRV